VLGLHAVHGKRPEYESPFERNRKKEVKYSCSRTSEGGGGNIKASGEAKMLKKVTANEESGIHGKLRERESKRLSCSYVQDWRSIRQSYRT
jgi:hypothetical protein